MERITQGLNRLFHGNKRQMITAAAALFIINVLLLAGIFSYFHSEDAVANRMTAPQGSVTVIEPKWDAVGQQKAARQEPGMEIQKDPKGYNDGSVDEYIRLVLTVETMSQLAYNLACDLPSPAHADTENGEIAKKTEAERLEDIVNAIVFVDEDDHDAESPFLTINSSQAITDCANGKFVADPANKSTSGNKLTYYFYYTDGDLNDDDEPLMHVVPPNSPTATLFHRVDIPIYKKEYLGVFDYSYSITIKAEAIPVGDHAVLRQSDAVALFDNQ